MEPMFGLSHLSGVVPNAQCNDRDRDDSKAHSIAKALPPQNTTLLEPERHGTSSTGPHTATHTTW